MREEGFEHEIILEMREVKQRGGGRHNGKGIVFEDWRGYG